MAAEDVNADSGPWLSRPHFLPDGGHLLFIAGGPEQEAELYVTSVKSGATELLLRTTSMARYAAPGYLVFARGTSLLAQPFDVGQLAVTGPPVRLADDVVSTPIYDFDISISDHGGLAYANAVGAASQLRWLDRTGNDLGPVGRPGDHRDPVVSPDEARIAVERTGDIWLLDALRGTEQRFTFDSPREAVPIWSPDGTRIVFSSSPPGGLYVKDVAGARSPQVLLETNALTLPTDWSLDGESVSYTTQGADLSWDLGQLSMSGDGRPTSFLQTPFREWAGMLSPDGRWMAYDSNESGERQVYVQPISPGGQLLISRDGGMMPRWRGDGRELYYVSRDNELMAVEIETTGDSLDVGIPRSLFRVSFREPEGARNVFDVTADGQRFLVNTLVEDAGSQSITWVLNWTAELEQ